MGSESSHNSYGHYSNYETNRREQERCYPCNGSGRVYIESQCYRCRDYNTKAMYKYKASCSCNGTGRETAEKTCHTCSGRGYH